MRRRFGPGRPDSVWAGDITFVPTAEGWLYLAAVLDVGSRRLIGYSMAADMPARLAVDALDTAAPSDTSISKCCDDPLNLVNISRPTSRLRWRATGCASPQAGWGTARCNSVCESFSPPSNESSSTSAASRHATRPAARSSPGSPDTTPSASTQHSTTKPRQNGSNTTHDNDYTKPHKQCVQPTGGSPPRRFPAVCWGESGFPVVGFVFVWLLFRGWPASPCLLHAGRKMKGMAAGAFSRPFSAAKSVVVEVTESLCRPEPGGAIPDAVPGRIAFARQVVVGRDSRTEENIA